MPRQSERRKVLVIGSGPIQIGQACEFDYSGTQAIKALKEEGLVTILVNSNPATIMTDPEWADRVYIEPLCIEILHKIIEKERPDCLLPTVGGQTALNLARELHYSGILDEFNVQLIGAGIEAIETAEDRRKFREKMLSVGIRVPRGVLAHSWQEAREVVAKVGFPCVIRPAFTLGGSGGGIAESFRDFEKLIPWALESSPIRQILIEESLLGWKEFELEVMRDCGDNVVIICSIENLDPMGIHTGDSVTVAPAQTLSDRQYHEMRDTAIRAIRAIGVDTGGCNIQFAIHPETLEQVIIEINPRVSRSSALASKATGFPIAKIAAKLAIGYRLDEIPNDITRATPASFEPTIDYVVTKIPRFNFEKFPGTPPILTTQMKSVGEVMAIGRTFKESLLKAIRSLEIGRQGLENSDGMASKFAVLKHLKIPTADRLWQIAQGLRLGLSVDEIYEVTRIDRWFLSQIQEIVLFEKDGSVTQGLGTPQGNGHQKLSREWLKAGKKLGMSDHTLAGLTKSSEDEVRQTRLKFGISPYYHSVDTCAAEFEVQTPYLYSSYEGESEFPPTRRKKVVILGSGPNRIGQGIEFDYACVHASLALREAGFETVMINCNPETVSTDYDISDRLYFEPLTFEDVMPILEREKPDGVLVQFGGQTPLKLTKKLSEAGMPLWGTSASNIESAEDRRKFHRLVSQLNVRQPEGAVVSHLEEAASFADKVGFPVIVRPSHVLGGRAMEIIYDHSELRHYLKEAFEVSKEYGVLIDEFLQDAREIDVDAVSDGKRVWIAGVMEHVEEAGVHSGDSIAVLPPFSLSQSVIRAIENQTKMLADALCVKGLLNVQFAIQDSSIYVLEANPRASRTIPFISKATRIPWAKGAARIMAGLEWEPPQMPLEGFAVKVPVFPFEKFPGFDPLLSPEMRSTGEVMGWGKTLEEALVKGMMARGFRFPKPPGQIFLSVHDGDKEKVLGVALKLLEQGFTIVATKGTHQYLLAKGIPSTQISKIGQSPELLVKLERMEFCMVINTTRSKPQVADSFVIRRRSLEKNIPHFTNLNTAKLVIDAYRHLGQSLILEVNPL